MSLAEDTTAVLWSRFMPRRHEIQNKKGTAFYSVEVYPDLSFFSVFDPGRTFEKWAAIAVDSFSDPLPEGMEKLVIDQGLYAVFTYRGLPSEARGFYRYIYGEWIPGSDYQVDDRPHFGLMGAGYKGEDPNSEEEIWVPLKRQLN
jgi:AraC family transcriptional regulator